jgi:hypothetical protein
MSLFHRTCYAAATLLAAQFFAGCSSQSSAVPVSYAAQRAATTSGALLYVSDPQSGVSFYTYPGLKLEGKISITYVTALCTDPRTGNVWVVSYKGAYKLSEYAHGATEPIRKFKVNADDLTGCAVNPINGDVALTEMFDYDDPGALLILTPGHGNKISRYQARGTFAYYFVTYDPDGDAFVDGYGGGNGVRLDELMNGSAKLVSVSPHHLRIPLVGNVQYDGTDVIVGAQKHGKLYEIADQKVVGGTQLLDTCLVRQFAIDGGVLIAPSACHSHGDVLIYNYPAGGSPTAKLTGFKAPYAVTISQ